MARTIVIEAGTSLTYTPDSADATRTIVLSKWICDKHFDKVLLKSAYGNPIEEIKGISATNPITIDTIVVTTPAAAQLAIGANW